MSPVRHDVSLLSDEDVYLFNEGTHARLYERLGAHPIEADGEPGTVFAVWAPNADGLSVIGDFNGWDRRHDPLQPRGSSGIWEGFVPGVRSGDVYKLHVASRVGGYRVDKGDPFAARWEVPPRTASVVWDTAYAWGDDAWMRARGRANALDAPMSVYEVHLGSWARDEQGRMLGYREIGHRLAIHVKALNFTHVELLPVMEHPFYGSWGYQTTGYFAPTSRYGTPQDLMAMIDHLHREGIGVILDWVPSHFASDEHGLAFFDGTHLFEHADPRQGFHPDWGSYIFNYGRNEVRSFLLSSATHWLDRYHADGLRVDAVASMLYLDYSRKPGEWIPNELGGRENLRAVEFLRGLNSALSASFPDVQTTAEESTAWPGVSRPVESGGLGFGMKWDMGWMHDTLQYVSKDPVHRSFQHDTITFRMLYAFDESFVLPLSHDEVVHGKGSLIAKMPGDDWQRFANLRLLFAYQFAQPGKKLLFMGGELAQWGEWNHETSLDWDLLAYAPHEGVRRLVADLARLHRDEPALHELDTSPEGFQWVDASDRAASVLSFLRTGMTARPVLFVANFTPVPRHRYRVGVPVGGRWIELANTDAEAYGGSGQGNYGGLETDEVPMHGRERSLSLVLPPLAAVFLTPEGR
ncbi:MAG TPA: 1,4-alpha-glucan branching protein GlgB [Actinomycetota bacterium]